MAGFKLDHKKISEFSDRWSDISPAAGTEECICMVCAMMIGAAENDPRWDDHDEFCSICEVCEVPIRIFDELRNAELRFHAKCFESLFRPEGKGT